MNFNLLKEILAAGIGGGIGSILRFLLSFWVQEKVKNEFFPWGIFSVNLLGCLAIGILFGIFVERFNVGPILRTGIFIGVLGGFTTFSSFSMDTINLLYYGAYGTALIYISITVVGCILATAAGLSLVRVII